MSQLENDYIPFVQWLLDNEDMQKWFFSLSSSPIELRTIELRNKALSLMQTEPDQSISTTIAKLADEDVFDAIRAVLLAELNQR